MDTKGWAVVTGASSGLGRGFAKKLAADGRHLVLVARNAEALAALAEELRTDHAVDVDVMISDLSDARDRDRVATELASRRVDILINNAGAGSLRPLSDSDYGQIARDISLNCIAVTALSRAVVDQMIQRGAGTIVNVASTAALQPVPSMSVYAATKSYVLHFSLALAGELQGSGVTVLTLCPGATDTNFFSAAGQDTVPDCRSVDQVVTTLTTALDAGSPIAIDGRFQGVVSRTAARLPMPLVLPFARVMARAEWALRRLPGR